MTKTFYRNRKYVDWLTDIRLGCASKYNISLSSYFYGSSGIMDCMLFKPLSHQTAMPQRLYSVQKPCQRAVGSPQNTPKNITFVSHSVYITSSQRPYSVHTTFPQRLYSAHDVFTARKQLLQRVYNAHTAFSRRAHNVLMYILIDFMIICFIRGALTTRLRRMLKTNTATWRSRRLHSVAGVCTACTSAFCIFKRCVNAVKLGSHYDV